MPASANNAPKNERKEIATFHNAAFSVFGHYLREHKENGDITLEDEHCLSKQPPRIDIIIIKKNRNTKINRVWGRIFREHNIIEYKSPADKSPTLAVFNKVVHGYVGLYAAQEDVKLIDMSATIVCPRRPKRLFKTLVSEFGYKILQKGNGVYYIIQEGVAVEKSLAIQIVVSPELPDSEFFLKYLRRGIDRETAKRVGKLFERSGKNLDYLVPWFRLMFTENGKILRKEGVNMTKFEKFVNFCIEEEDGFLADTLQKVRLEGEQEGMTQILNYLKSGHSIEEAEKMFAVH